MKRQNKKGYVYLLHFDEPYYHAKHYVGSTDDIEQRLIRHKNGNGARLIKVISDAGISFRLAKLWTFDNIKEARLFEKALKHMKNTPRYCPECRK